MTTQPAPPLATALAGIRVLLLDFDGPVCDVFAGRPAAAIADQLRDLLISSGAPRHEVQDDDDPLSLYARSAAYGPEVVAATYAALVNAEREAVTSAVPTPGAIETVVAARETGRHVAIVSNNAADAVLDYLNRHGLSPMVSHVAARRTPDPDLMKPNPRYLHEAIDVLGTEPQASAIVGDSVTDIEAATRANTRAIGYANKPGKNARLANAGADAVIESMAELPPALSATAPH